MTFLIIITYFYIKVVEECYQLYSFHSKNVFIFNLDYIDYIGPKFHFFSNKKYYCQYFTIIFMIYI